MTSLKKPLIAIASAVALVGTMLVAGPANASSATLTVAGNAPATAGTSSATAIALSVPSDNDVSSADAVRIALSGVTAGSNVTVTATNAKIVTAVTSGSTTVKVDSGVSTATIPTGTGTTADIYVYTTTTETGTVVVSANGNTTTYFVKGAAGPAYNLFVTAPKVANLGGTAEVTATTTDVFGNVVTNATITNASVGSGTLGAFGSYVTADKVYKATFTATSVAGTAVVESSISASAVAGLPKPVTSVMHTIVVANLAEQVTVLAEKVAALQVIVDRKVSKKKYNTLARKWNRANPTDKVKLKK
jgi:hypothetical protein